MTTQSSLFIESFEEAIRDAVHVLGGPKSVGVLLWPSMRAELAGRRLNQCLDPERDEKFDLAEVLLIAREARKKGCHTVMHFLGEQLDYKVEPIDPDTVDARERRELATLLRSVNERIERMEKRDSDRGRLRSVA